MILTKIALYFISILIFIKIGTSILKYANRRLRDLNEEKKFQYGILSMQDLYEYGLSKFLSLCKIYLDDLGFYNIEEAYVDFNNVDYICTENSKKVYVGCVLEDLSKAHNKDEEIYSVGRPDVQRFLGQMVHDEVTRGVIITNGSISRESIEFVKELDKERKILLVDGYVLTKRLRELNEINNLIGGAIFE